MKRADILDSARQSVTQDRAATHGQPENTFGQIAALWSARLGQRITPAQVCIMLVDLKTARAWDNPAHGDNWTDMAGYAACGGELAVAEPVKVKPRPTVQQAEPKQGATGAELEPVKRKPKRRYKAPNEWTEAEDEKAVAMAVEGKIGAEIAEALGRPVEGTKWRLKNKLADKIAAELQRVEFASPKSASIAHPDFTPEQDARLRSYIFDGLGVGGAAALLRIPRDRVAERWDQINTQESAE